MSADIFVNDGMLNLSSGFLFVVDSAHAKLISASANRNTERYFIVISLPAQRNNSHSFGRPNPLR
jgi:hypothetical protein